ncbi:MAG: lipoate--protein ligase [Clostridia bacterium]|nr:lipoate--protein ligase [Clostridia bacterium]
MYIYESNCVDPYRNIATEKYLLEHVESGCCILYLWQNAHTVVIGRNQNPWSECRTSLLEQEGGFLARRLSGGGAVYHDLGNLNFTFLVRDEDYDVDRQLSVIQTACLQLGINAEKSGRNDLIVDGQKFSGNAFYHSKGQAYHHGTLLVSADMEKLSRYLTPPKAKLEAKGVRSVRSRVTNLSALRPGLTCDALKPYLVSAFEEVYGCKAAAFPLSQDATAKIDTDAAQLKSYEWLYGSRLPCTFSCEARFPWGHIQLELSVSSGIIQDVATYTDAMDWLLPEQIHSALIGCRFALSEMTTVLEKLEDKTIRKDIIALLRQQDI